MECVLGINLHKNAPSIYNGHEFFDFYIRFFENIMRHKMHECTYEPDWYKANQSRINKDKLCRGELDVTDQFDYPFILYAYSQSTREIIGFCAFSPYHSILYIHSLCALENTSKIGTLLIQVMKTIVIKMSFIDNRIKPCLLLHNIGSSVSTKFYKKMNFKLIEIGLTEVSSMERELIGDLWMNQPGIWYNEEVMTLHHTWETLGKTHTYMSSAARAAKKEGTRRKRKRSIQRYKTPSSTRRLLGQMNTF